MWELYEDLMCWLAKPGKMSKACWRETYEIRENLECADKSPELDRYRGEALCKMIEVASKTARVRRERLPDSLHNMMILNSGGVKPLSSDHIEWWTEGLREDSARNVLVYVKMLEKIRPAQKASC